MQGVIDALKGVSKRTPTVLLQGHGSADGGALCADGDEFASSLLDESAQYQLYIKSYDNCQDAMRDVLAPLASQSRGGGARAAQRAESGQATRADPSSGRAPRPRSPLGPSSSPPHVAAAAAAG